MIFFYESPNVYRDTLEIIKKKKKKKSFIIIIYIFIFHHLWSQTDTILPTKNSYDFVQSIVVHSAFWSFLPRVLHQKRIRSTCYMHFRVCFDR